MDDFDECPLYHQLIKTKAFQESGTDIGEGDDWLLDKLVILDFDRIFGRRIGQKMNADNSLLQEKVQDLMEKGLTIRFEKHSVHMLPFDKSGNMSRHSRITFLNEAYYEELNERLNLGMDFSGMKVTLSKYYAYRGLYLTSSKRIEHDEIAITPETLVIVRDKRMKEADEKEFIGKIYEKKVPIATATSGEMDSETNTRIWEFPDVELKEMEYVETPFDGTGILSPEYAGFLNEALKVSGATSFQVRMPFVKGMLHQVDFRQFLTDFDPEGMEQETYLYEDAFGIERDLKKAQFLLTESMFKGMKWLVSHCEKKGIADPMEYYCEAFQRFGHALYISGTNLPYGHSEYTHLSYQMINTLDFKDKEFEQLARQHESFIKNPKDYLIGWDASEAYNYEDTDICYETPAWKEALKANPELEKEPYIAEQLGNTRKGLITKTANGKLVVAGQTRFLCRDLMFFLACLIKSPAIASDFYLRFLFFRFYMPMDSAMKDILIRKYKNLKYSGFCAFFRNPHLSRNEQCVLQPFELPAGDETYFQKGRMPIFEKYAKYVGYYQKYFGHLTGVVMVPRGSIVPLCLGGADFDGDLVTIIYDEDVVNAVRRGCYQEWLWRKQEMPVIKIPSPEPRKEIVPKYVPYEHIKNTFSNAIGYLSNLSISIGQKEYGDSGESQAPGKGMPQEGKIFDPKKTACWKCTILTGLEIDAAKNGEHPYLGVLGSTKSKFPKARYLEFRETYERFRSNPSFRFEGMQIEKEPKSDNEYSLRFHKKAKGENRTKPYICTISDENYGTKINQLPLLFLREFEGYQAMEKARQKQKFLPLFQNAPEDAEKVNWIRDFQKDCKTIMDFYFSYRKLAKQCRHEKNKASYGSDKLNKLVAKLYDTENERRIMETILPGVRDKIARAIPKDASIGEIQAGMNAKGWQFQPYKRRAQVLEEIIGNGFRTSELEEEEQEFLFHFNEQGYRMLWHLLDYIKETRPKAFEEIKKSMTWKKDSGRDCGQMEEKLEEVIKSFYERNLTNVDSRLYRICLEELKETIKQSKLSPATKINSLYEVAGKDPKRGRFFWDAFTWADLKPYSSIKGGDGVLC